MLKAVQFRDEGKQAASSGLCACSRLGVSSHESQAVFAQAQGCVWIQKDVRCVQATQEAVQSLDPFNTHVQKVIFKALALGHVLQVIAKRRRKRSLVPVGTWVCSIHIPLHRVFAHASQERRPAVCAAPPKIIAGKSLKTGVLRSARVSFRQQRRHGSDECLTYAQMACMPNIVFKQLCRLAFCMQQSTQRGRVVEGIILAQRFQPLGSSRLKFFERDPSLPCLAKVANAKGFPNIDGLLQHAGVASATVRAFSQKSPVSCY